MPQAILETGLYVDDLVKARPFYEGILGLPVVDEQAGRHLFFRCGRGMLLLFIADACATPGGLLPTHGAHGPGHMAFTAADDEELAMWQQHLAAQGVAIEATVDWPNGGRSIYFRDPAGNSLEFATPKLWGFA
jgi:catechol 2,3-dioxygenase-like lactoylglutathione lyase family enzyme